jgi:hypothetical protein
MVFFCCIDFIFLGYNVKENLTMDKKILDEVLELQKKKSEHDTAYKNLVEKLFNLLRDPVYKIYTTNREEWNKYPEIITFLFSEELVFSAFDIETYSFRKEAKPWVINSFEETNDASLKKMVSFINNQWGGIATFEARLMNSAQFEIKVLFI